ncbi:MAG: hypothetical protein JWP85_2092 [Rhodoglobus sp.]|nr:hypothetical protein [Rhodoglobus sp.]
MSTIQQTAPVRYRDEEGVEVEALHILTADDVRTARSLSDWHDGQVRILTFRTAEPVLFVGQGEGNDVAAFGRQVSFGQYLVKGPAGDLEPMPAVTFEARFTAAVNA